MSNVTITNDAEFRGQYAGAHEAQAELLANVSLAVDCPPREQPAPGATN